MNFFLLFIIFYFTPPATSESPLASFSKEWNNPKYIACNTAAQVTYMSEKEKEVIYIINLSRMNPILFSETVVKKYPETSDEPGMESSGYFKSLVEEMMKMQPIALLIPDSLCYVSAYCHAFNSGKTGFVGHTRTKQCNAVKHFNGECCDYGNSKPIDIVMNLLIDENVESLGHRRACFDTHYKGLGVSIQPHKNYGTNAVLDFIN